MTHEHIEYLIRKAEEHCLIPWWLALFLFAGIWGLLVHGLRVRLDDGEAL